jgi:hypothetical protein
MAKEKLNTVTGKIENLNEDSPLNTDPPKDTNPSIENIKVTKKGGLKKFTDNLYKSAEIDGREYKTFSDLVKPGTGITDLDKIFKIQEAGFADKYTDYISPNIAKSGNVTLEKLNQYRAENQSNWEQFGNAWGRLATNIIPQIIGGFSSMVDIPGYFSAEEAANNALVNWAADIKEQSEEWFPIYEEAPGESMQMGDFAWWMTRGEGLVESVGAFLAQGAGAAKIASWGLKGLASTLRAKDLTRTILSTTAKGKNLSKGASRSKNVLGVANTLTTATMLNQSEAVLEATQVYRDVIKDRLEKGYSKEEAKKAAASAAATTMNINRINILLNLSSAAAFLQPMKFTRKLLKAPSKARTFGRLGLEAGQEGVEELVNLAAEKAGRAKGRGEGYSFDQALKDIKTMEGFEAAFLGAIGGIAQTGGQIALSHSKYGPGSAKDADGNRISAAQQTKERYEAQQQAIEELKSKGVDISEALFGVKQQLQYQNELEKAQKIINDPKSTPEQKATAEAKQEELQNALFENQTLKAFETGTTETLINLYQSIAEGDPDLMKAKYGKNYKEKVDQAIKDIETLEDIYNNFEDYANVSEIFYNRANSIRTTRLKGYYEALNDEADADLRQQLSQISKKYKFKNERTITTKRNGKETTETVTDESPLYFKSDNLEENTGDTDENKETYNKFLEEVKATQAFKNKERYQENLENVDQSLNELQEQFNEITSNKYQKKYVEKVEQEKKKAETIRKIKGSKSKAELKKMRDEYAEDEEMTKLIDKRVEELEVAQKEEAKKKANTVLKGELDNEIRNASDPNEIPDLRKRVNESSLSAEEKKELNNLLNAKAHEFAGGPVVPASSPVPPASKKDVENTEEQDDIERQKQTKGEYETNSEEEGRVKEETKRTFEEVAESGKSKALDEEGRAVSYSRSVAGEGYSLAAYLSRKYDQKDDGVELSREDIDNEILPNENLKLVLNHNNVQPGTKITFKVKEDYDGEIYKKDSTKKETIEWQGRLEQIKKNTKEGENYQDSDEYINEVPIVAIDENGNELFYMHETSWINEQNLEGPESDLQVDRANLVRLRNEVIQKGELESKITSKSDGVLLRTVNNENILVSEAMPDSELILGIGNDDNSFTTNGKKIDGVIINETVKKGGLYAIVPINKGRYIALPLSRTQLSEQITEAVYTAIEAHLSNNQAVIDAIYKATGGDEGGGINISEIDGLRKYIGQFLYLFPTEGNKGLEPILSGTQSFTSDNGIITITATGIEFGRPGVIPAGNNVKATVLSKNFNPEENQRKLGLLRSFLQKYIKSNINRDNLGENKPVVISDAEGNIQTIAPNYTEYAKQVFQTNVFSVNIGTDEEPNWIYTIQPKITFDTSNVKLKKLPKRPKGAPKGPPPGNLTPPIEDGIEVTAYGFTYVVDAEGVVYKDGVEYKDQNNRNAEAARKKAEEARKERTVTEDVEEGAQQNLEAEALLNALANEGYETVAQLEDLLQKTEDQFNHSAEQQVPEETLDAFRIHIKTLEDAIELKKSKTTTKSVPGKGGLGNIEINIEKSNEEDTAEDAEDAEDDGDFVDEMIPILDDTTDENKKELQKKLKEEAAESIILGLSSIEQNSLLLHIGATIYEQAQNKEEGVAVSEVFAAAKKQLQEMEKLYREGGDLKKAKKVAKILEQFDKVKRLTKQYLSALKTARVEEAGEEESTGEVERTNFSEDFQMTLDSKTTASAKLRQFLGFTYVLREDGSYEASALGFPLVVEFDTVYNTLHELLANQRPDLDTLLDIMEQYKDTFKWLPDIIKKLKAADEGIQNEFVSDMTKHAIEMQFLLWKQNKNGSYQLTNYAANSASIKNRILQVWDANLRGQIGNTLVTINDAGDYGYSEAAIDRLVKQANEWEKLSDFERDQIKNEDVAQWLADAGIIISDLTFIDLRRGKYYNNGRVLWKELFTKDNGLIQVLKKELKSKKDNKVTLAEKSIMDDSAVKALAALEAKNSLNVFSNSFMTGGKTIYTYTNNKFAINRMRDILDPDKILLNELKNINFTKDSLYLKELLSEDEDIREALQNRLGVRYLGLEAIKQLFTGTRDNRKLNNLSEAEHEIIKIGLFQSDSNQLRIKGKKKSGRRKVTFFYPTMSDKSTMMLLNTLSYKLRMANIEEGELSNQSAETLFNALILPEVNRIAATADSKSNIEGYEPSYFYFLPELNDLVISSSLGNKTVRELAMQGSEFITDPAVKEQLIAKIKTIFTELLEAKKADWARLGIGTIEKGNFNFLNERYMKSTDNVHGRTKEDKLTYAAADFLFNSLIANAEMFKLIIGDPAQYAKKIKTNEDGTINLDETFVNIGKRLAGDIAPGMELANSHKNSYYQLLMSDRKVASLNIEYLEKLHKRGLLTKEDLKAYKEIDSTDAQEWTTWQEHLYVLRKLGRITSGEYAKIKSTLEAGKKLSEEELGLVMQPMKPVYVGNQIDHENSLDRRIYIKSSSFPLLPQLTEGLQIDKVRIMLDNFQKAKEDAGEVTKEGEPLTVRASFSTANKVGGIKNGIEVFDKDGNVKDEITKKDFHKKITKKKQALELQRKNFRIQQDVPFKEDKSNINVGTQERKLLFVDILDVKGFQFRGKEYTGKELKKIYNNTWKEIFEYKQKQLAEELGIDLKEEVDFPVDKLQKILIKEVKSRKGYPPNMISSLELNEAGDDFKIPLWASPYAKEFEALLTSFINNSIVKNKFKGQSFVLGSAAGFKGEKNENLKEGREAFDKAKNKGGIVFTEDFDPEKGLQPMRVDSEGNILPAQVLVPFKFRDESGNLLEIEKFITKTEDGRIVVNTDKLPDKIRKMFGFRIPTQKHNSFGYIEIVGFLPKDSGDLIIAPDDFVAQMGSDFDVDKLYAYMYNTFYKDGKLHTNFLSNEEQIKEKIASLEQKIEGLLDEIGVAKEDRDLFYQVRKDIFNKVKRDEKAGVKDAWTSIEEELKTIIKAGPATSKLIKNFYEKVKEIQEAISILERSRIASLQNKIVEIHFSVMSNNNDAVLRSIFKPDSFGGLKSLGERLDKVISDTPITILADMYQRQKYLNGTAGKDGTGAFSLDSTFNAIAQGEDLVYFYNPDVKNRDSLTHQELLAQNNFRIKFGSSESRGDLSNKSTLNEEKLKSEIITAFQSASVDNEKAQLLHKFNVNSETFEVVKAMALLGFDEKDIVGLLTQPMIIEYINNIKNARSSLLEYNEDMEAEVFYNLSTKYDPARRWETLTKEEIEELEKKTDALGGEELLKLVETKTLEVPADEKSKTDDFILIQFELIAKLRKLKNVGSEIRQLQSAINTESKGVPKNLLEVDNKVEQINSMIESPIANAINLVGEFGTTNVDTKTPFSRGKETLVNPTTVSGFATYYGTMLADQIYSKYFPYKKRGFKDQVKAIIEHHKQDISDITPTQMIEIKNKIFEASRAYLYSDKDLGLFTEAAELERRRLFIDTNNNMSLARILTSLSSEAWFQKNEFLNKLIPTVNIEGNASRIDFEASTGENLNEGHIYTAFQKLLNQKGKSNIIGEFNGYTYTKQMLAQDLILYAFLEGGSQKAKQFLKYIPTAYLKYTNFGNRLSEIDFNYERTFGGVKVLGDLLYDIPSRFTRQYFQNFPQEAKGIDTSQMIFDASKTKLENLKEFKLNGQGIEDFKVELNKGSGEFTLTKFVAINSSVFSGNFALFEFDSDSKSYKRIVTLSDKYGFVQFNRQSIINQSVQNKQNFSGRRIVGISPPGNTPPVGLTIPGPINPTAAFNPDVAENGENTRIEKLGDLELPLNLKGRDFLENLFDQLELSDNVSPYYKNLIEKFRTLDLPRGFNVEVINTKTGPEGRWGTITKRLQLNKALLNNKNLNYIAMVLLHELVHVYTAMPIRHWDNKNFSENNKDQNRIIATIDGLKRKYIRSLIKNGDKEAFVKFYLNFLKYRLDSKEISEAKYKELLKNIPEVGNIDEFLGDTKKWSVSSEELSKFYGTVNTREFVAMALTDPEFQKRLNEVEDNDGAPFWSKFVKLLVELLNTLGIDVKPDSILATSLEEIMALIDAGNNTIKPAFQGEGDPGPFVDDPNTAPIFKEGDIVEYKGERGTIEQVKDSSKQANYIKVRFSDPNRALEIKPGNLTYISSAPTEAGLTGQIETISPDYGVVKVETNPLPNETEQVVNLIRPQVEAQTFKENKGKNANMMFHYGLRWGRRKGNPSMGIGPMKAPIKNNPADGGTYYGYDLYDQNGNPLPPISDLQPIINEIQNSLGIDMSDYDSVIGNIYLPGEYVYPHRDTTESKSAEGYPVVVYTIGNNAGLGIWDGNKGKKTFANTYDSTYAPGTLANNNPTNEVLTKNGTIYTFGMDGKGRFNLVHTTPDVTEKPNAYPPLKLPNGKTVTNYTITLTFRRADKLEEGMPEKPANIKTKKGVKITTTLPKGPEIIGRIQRVTDPNDSAVKSIVDVDTGKTPKLGDWVVDKPNYGWIVGETFEEVNNRLRETPTEETSTAEVKKESSFTYNGITLKTEFPLGEQQEVALKELINFALDPNPSLLAWTLEGYAGTGKTSIIALVEQYLKKAQPGSKFAYIAPTHAATVALGLNTIKYGNKDLPATLASSMYLKKVKGVPTPTLTRKIMDRLQGFNRYIVIDEASMLKKGEVEQILAAAAQQNIKVIFTGDPKQIPAVVTGNIKQKPVSPVFNFAEKSVLDKVYRTGDQALLDILTKIRNNTDFVEYKSDENTEELQFVTSGIYARELRQDLEENPENVTILSYTNQSVQQNNKSAREMLGIEGELQEGEKIIGYLGSGVKTVDRKHLANSIAYTVTKVKKEEEGKVWITADSNTLKQVIDKGMKIPSSKTTFSYLQLSKTDSLDFNLTEEQLENNNRELSSIYREIHRLKQSYDAKKISYTQFLDGVYQQQLLASDYNTLNAYIYNPASDKMELYNRVTHQYLDSKLKTEKGVDFGYAITIHKSQGMTIPKVYFDPSSLRPAGNVKVMSGGKQINTEKNSLYYVAMSRASKKLVVLDTGGAQKAPTKASAEEMGNILKQYGDTSRETVVPPSAIDDAAYRYEPEAGPDEYIGPTLPTMESLETFKRNCG